MKILNVYELKVQLSKYVPYLLKGGVIQLCRRNQPIAIIQGIPEKAGAKRILGSDAGKFAVEKMFFDPLPAEFLQFFQK